MTSVAKGGFPGRPKKKVEKRRVRTYNPTVGSHTQINTIRLCNQIKNNLERFRVLFGDSDGVWVYLFVVSALTVWLIFCETNFNLSGWRISWIYARGLRKKSRRILARGSDAWCPTFSDWLEAQGSQNKVSNLLWSSYFLRLATETFMLYLVLNEPSDCFLGWLGPNTRSCPRECDVGFIVVTERPPVK